jgi:uracil-DNA glycosylase family 4
MRKHPLAECETCPLQGERSAKTTGPNNAKVAVISRSPGANDVRVGKPFSGPSGEVLDHLLETNGYARKNVLVTNLVLCYSENPPQGAISACKARLQDELRTVDTVIVAGAEAVKELIGKTSIKSARGVEHHKEGKRYIATNNPAAVLYDSDSFPNLVEDFKLALNPPPPIVYPKVNIVNTRAVAIRLFKDLAMYGGEIAVDVEGHTPHLECIGFSMKPDEADVIPRHVLTQVWDELKTLLESNGKWLWHNGVYDVKLLRRNGIQTHIAEDTFPLSWCLDERESGVHGLSYLSRTQLGWLNYEPESVEHYKETGILPEDIDELHKYNGYDCAATLQLFSLLRDRAVGDGVYELYRGQKIPLMNALVDIELRGFHYDAMAAADLNELIVIPKLRELKAALREIVGLELFNPASPQQVAAYLYDTCGLIHQLKSTRKKSYARATGKEVRKEITEGRFHCKSRYEDKLVAFAKEAELFSQINKQRGTYLEGLIKRVSDDGKLYCTFNPCGPATGRLSSRVPNFQNITREAKDIVPGIRKLFKPSPGNVLVQADYSQAELRCIAKLSGDNELRAIYRESGRSLHRETASAFYGPGYTKEEYVKSKNINFGVCYEQSAFMFSQMYQMPQKEAQRYIDAWFERFPDVLKWKESVKARVISDDAIVAPFGGKRRFHLITEENLEEVKRQAINFYPQNTASEFTVWSLCQLNSMGVPIISTVHDSIIADVPQRDAMDVALLMKQVMESAPSKTLGWDDMPFTVDISMSEISWGDVEEIEILATV